MDFNIGGNDELSDAEVQAHSRQHDALTAQLEAAVITSNEAKAWLNTTVGKSVRKMISTNKFEAMRQAVADVSPEQVEKARYDYDIWNCVENVFAQIICAGDEALNELQIREDR